MSVVTDKMRAAVTETKRLQTELAKQPAKPQRVEIPTEIPSAAAQESAHLRDNNNRK